METLTAEPREHTPAGTSPQQGPGQNGPSPSQQAAEHTPLPGRSCPACGAPMEPAQDWCVQCGARSPAAFGTPSWRSTGALAGAAIVLVLAAAGAGYAALSKSPPKARLLTRTVAQAAPPAAAPPAAAPAATPPPAKTLTTAPKIPLATATPKAPATTPAAAAPSTPASHGTTTTPASGGGSGGETSAGGQGQSAIVLDTNAASTYNPYALPAGDFGDPTLAIDGDPSTGWSALVDPASAPRMEAGLVIDLNSPQRVASLLLITSTPGLTVQVYGAKASPLPTVLTDPAWVKLKRATVVHKRHARLSLREAAHSFRYVLLWISRAPAGAGAGRGHVSVDEVELFAPR